MLEKCGGALILRRMGRRRRPRAKGILPVRIWGFDREGQPFVEHVCTIDISGMGAKLAGVHAQLAVGDTIGLQYRSCQTRARIVRIIPADATGTHVGVECLQPKKTFWPLNLPSEEPDPYTHTQAEPWKYENRNNNRRRRMRFPVRGRAYVSKISGGQGVSAQVLDISLDGCYLQMSEPMEVGNRLTLLIEIAHAELVATGVVRIRYPGRAMGMEFMFMSKPDRHSLTRLISHLEELDTVVR